MTIEKSPEEARSGQKLVRDRYLLPGLLAISVVGLVVILVFVG